MNDITKPIDKNGTNAVSVSFLPFESVSLMMLSTRQKISAVLKMNTPDAKPLNSTSAESIITSPKPRRCFDRRLMPPRITRVAADAMRLGTKLPPSAAFAKETANSASASHSENSLLLRS